MNEVAFRKRKIAVAITHRTPYGRLKPVLNAIKAHPKLELQIIVATSVFMHNLFFALRHVRPASWKDALPWYIKARSRAIFGGAHAINQQDSLAKIIKGDGFEVRAHLPLFLEGGTLETMTKSVGAGLLGIPDIFKKLSPDIVLVHADRFEMLPFAIAASMMNVPIAHTQGGDVSGTIDETVRHTITKLAHLHFPTTEKSRNRLIRMGEDPRYVFMTGCPTIDFLKNIDLSIDADFYKRNSVGFGKQFDLKKPFILVLQHPVTTEYEFSKKVMEETLAAVREIRMPTFFFWPNLDAGSDGASSAVKGFIKNTGLLEFVLHKSMAPEDFYRVLNAATVAVGNSSSFIREGSYLGVPAVIIGSRQQGRERGENVVEVDCRCSDIVGAVKGQLKHGRYPSSNLYGDGRAAERIAEILSKVEPSIQKKFFEA